MTGSALPLGDDSEPLAAVSDGAGYLSLADSVGECFADQVEHLGAGCVGAGLLALEGDGAALEFGEVVHAGERYMLANTVDKRAVLANTIGMTTCTDCGATLQHDTDAESWTRTTVLYDPDVLDYDNNGQICPATSDTHKVAS